MNGSSKGIRSAEDLFNGSRPHCPQIHLVFQDYETSAKLVSATQREESPRRLDRQPRTDRIFISKPGEGPLSYDRMEGRLSSRASERSGEDAPDQLGLLSKKFAAALVGVAAPAPGPSDTREKVIIPPIVVDGEMAVVHEKQKEGPQDAEDGTKPKTITEQGEREADNSTGKGRNTRIAPLVTSRSDSATCRAVFAKYAAEKEAAARRKGSSMQAEGEKTSELED